jgi:hypothetical protein
MPAGVAEFGRAHPARAFPPVIARPGQSAELADIATGLMISVDPEPRQHTATVTVPPGTLLCFYIMG